MVGVQLVQSRLEDVHCVANGWWESHPLQVLGPPWEGGNLDCLETESNRPSTYPYTSLYKLRKTFFRTKMEQDRLGKGRIRTLASKVTLHLFYRIGAERV